MPFEERKAVLESLQCAPNVFGFDDSDNTAINAIHYVASFESDNIRFCNGGDRTSANIPEQNSTYQTNVEFLFGVGGDDKKNFTLNFAMASLGLYVQESERNQSH